MCRFASGRKLDTDFPAFLEKVRHLSYYLTINRGLGPFFIFGPEKEETKLSNDREPMTPKGHSALKEKLRDLKEVQMPNVSEEIGRAREFGDLSENAEYHAAKEKQGLLAAQIRQLEDRLARAEVIDPGKLSGSRVIFGATVTLEDLDTGDEMKIQIVGQDEADTKENKISFNAPLAKAIINKEEDDEVKVNTPRGPKEYAVVKVEYIP